MMGRGEYAIFWTYRFQQYGIGPKMSYIKRQFVLFWIYAARLGVLGPKSDTVTLRDFIVGVIDWRSDYKSKFK